MVDYKLPDDYLDKIKWPADDLDKIFKKRGGNKTCL